jgi:hypothetical protein
VKHAVWASAIKPSFSDIPSISFHCINAILILLELNYQLQEIGSNKFLLVFSVVVVG